MSVSAPAAVLDRPDAPPRVLGFKGALSANVLNMVGVGPFITIPLALAAMGGPQALIGWIAGALLCLCDGLVWAELGSAMPRSGGPYHYLREAYGPQRLGRLFGFLYLWQTLLIGPLSIASGAVGFAQYATYLFPGLLPWHLALLAAALCLVNTALLCRRISSIERLSVLVSVVVIGACLWIVATGLFHFDAGRAFGGAPPIRLQHGLWMGLGAATLIAVYDYGGYNNVCMIGGEVERPRRTIPMAVLVSIPLVAVLYLGMNLSIIGALGWRTAAQSKAVVADFMHLAYGPWGGTAVAVMILVASWASVLAMLLGYSRVPYAAAADGEFFRVFARLDRKGGYPTVSLLTMGALAAAACVVPLGDLIAVLIVIQVMFQFIAQAFAVVLLRRRDRGLAREAGAERFRMPLYPVPVAVTVLGWLAIVATSNPRHVAIGAAMLAAGAAIYLVPARRRGAWPFAPEPA